MYIEIMRSTLKLFRNTLTRSMAYLRRVRMCVQTSLMLPVSCLATKAMTSMARTDSSNRTWSSRLSNVV
ncbi:hypothetical protein ALQ03_200024 [Pseudomonas savastanoi pv. glycinea]|nr:hypothetical protein ALQ03_200024 [Pseudomonas savastanoi pv. glycinea]